MIPSLDGLIVSHLPYGPTAYFGIQNCVLRHDIKDGLNTVSEAYPHIIFENFTTSLGERVRTEEVPSVTLLTAGLGTEHSPVFVPGTEGR